MFFKIGVLKNFAKFSGKHLRPEACNFIKKKTLVQVFSCELCEIFKNTFLYRISPLAASGLFIVQAWKNKLMFTEVPVK